MIIHKIDQNTEQWLDLRRGKFTASSIKHLFSKPTTAAYEKAIYSVAFERLTGQSPESFSNEWMQRGHELEASARMHYELTTGNSVEDGGFVEMDEWVGCSPDGLVDDDGLLEIKCPVFNTHMNYLMNGKLPSTYKWQVHSQIWITDRKWCDFMSYYPGLKEFIIRVNRDDALIAELEKAVESAKAEVEQIIKKLQ
jgi:putative phage-type endonuclease